MLLIPFADEYLGYCLSSHLSAIQSIRPQLRVLYTKNQQIKSNKKTNSGQSLPWLLNFASKGIDVRAVDYMHPNDMSLAVRNVDHIILSLDSHSDRVKRCKNICDLAVRSHVRSIIFISHAGATAAAIDDDNNNKYSALSDYREVENYLVQLQEGGGDTRLQWIILRLDWVQQYFHLWSCQAETTGSIAIPLYRDTKICPIDVSDVCNVISRLVVDDHGAIVTELRDCYVGQVYVLSGPQAMTITDIVKSIVDATQYKGFNCRDNNVTESLDTYYYLKRLSHNIWFDKRLKSEQARIFRDKLDGRFEYRTAIIRSPTDFEIQTYLEYFDWMNMAAASIVTSHTKLLLLGSEIRSLQNFFEENAINFKPRV